MWSFAPHDIALLLRLMGTLPIIAFLLAEGSISAKESHDVTLMSLEFPGPVLAHVFVSWLHPFKEQRFVVVGDRQMAVFDDSARWNEKLLLFPHQVDWMDGRVPVARRAEATAVSLPEREPLLEECHAFLRSMSSKEPPLTDGVSGVRVLSVLEAGQRSLDRGGLPITLNRERR